jgi:hypothetical protein
VSARGTLAIIHNSTRRAVLRAKKLASLPYLFWKQVFKPSALGLGGLVIAVALWGFGYKLSLYHRHPTPVQQATVAKLWIEQNASLAAVQRLRNQSHLVASPQALCSTFSWFPRVDRVSTRIVPVQGGGIPSVKLPVSLRSPPLKDVDLA